MISAVLFVLWGAVWGSYLGVLAVRIPQGTSLFFPGSRCDHCGRAIPFYRMIPLLSWILLKGRSACCGQLLLLEVPIAEFSTAAFFLFLCTGVHLWSTRLVLFSFYSFALPLTLIDLRHRRLPHVLTLPASLGGILLAGFHVGAISLLSSLAGFLFGFLPFAAISLIYPSGLGLGDAFLFGAIGTFVGPLELPIVLLVASSLTIIGGIVFAIFRKAPSIRKLTIPFGPFLIIGGIIALLVSSGRIEY